MFFFGLGSFPHAECNPRFFYITTYVFLFRMFKLSLDFPRSRNLCRTPSSATNASHRAAGVVLPLSIIPPPLALGRVRRFFETSAASTNSPTPPKQKHPLGINHTLWHQITKVSSNTPCRLLFKVARPLPRGGWVGSAGPPPLRPLWPPRMLSCIQTKSQGKE